MIHLRRPAATVFALIVGAASLGLDSARPAARTSACAERAARCCCAPCPGPPACPCDHSAPSTDTTCSLRAGDAGAAALFPEGPSSPPRLAFERPETPVFEPRLCPDFPALAGPNLSPRADPPDKVPLSTPA